MINIFTVLGACFLISIFTTGVLKKLMPINLEKKFYLYTTFFMQILVSILSISLVKKYGIYSLYQCFLVNGVVTTTKLLKCFLLYLGIIILFVLIMKKINKQIVNNLIHNYLCIFFIAYLGALTLFVRIDHQHYLGMTGISIVTSCIWTAVNRKDALTEFNLSRKTIIMKYRQIILPVFLLIFSIVIEGPFEIFLSNAKEFPFKFSDFWFVMVIAAFAYIVIIASVSVFFIHGKIFKMWKFILFYFSIAMYMQNMFLNGKMKVMDGTKAEWDGMTLILDAVLWLALLVAFYFLYCKSKKWNMIEIALSSYLILVQCIALGFLLLSTDLNVRDSHLTTDTMLELSDQHNIIVFVLDWYDEQFIERIQNEEPDFFQPLTDFTHYDNVTSSYAYTDLEIPYLLTGIPWEEGLDAVGYRRMAFEKSSFLKQLKQLGYSNEIYTNDEYADRSCADDIDNISSDLASEFYYDYLLEVMSRTAKYRNFPYFFKNYFWYGSSDINSAVKLKGLYNTDDDATFYQRLMEEKVHTKNKPNSKGDFKFYHLVGAHSPYSIDRNANYMGYGKSTVDEQIRGCMKITFEYIEQLKELGIYDDATIIITADHGCNYLDPDNKEDLEQVGLVWRSNPILFVKRSGVSGRGKMEVSQAPVCQENYFKSVLEEAGGKEIHYDSSFWEITEKDKKPREFKFGKPVKGRKFEDYEIQGDAKNIKNWKKK